MPLILAVGRRVSGPKQSQSKAFSNENSNKRRISVQLLGSFFFSCSSEKMTAGTLGLIFSGIHLQI